MVKVNVRESKDANVKDVISFDMELSDIDTFFGEGTIDTCLEYGFRVMVQKMYRGQHEKFEKGMALVDCPYTIEHDVKVEKADTEKSIIAKILGVPVSEVSDDTVAKVKATIRATK